MHVMTAHEGRVPMCHPACSEGTRQMESNKEHHLLTIVTSLCEFEHRIKHIEAETKWLPFARWHFQMPFRKWKCINFNKDFSEICSQRST